jgi:hypothetical protein
VGCDARATLRLPSTLVLDLPYPYRYLVYYEHEHYAGHAGLHERAHLVGGWVVRWVRWPAKSDRPFGLVCPGRMQSARHGVSGPLEGVLLSQTSPSALRPPEPARDSSPPEFAS